MPLNNIPIIEAKPKSWWQKPKFWFLTVPTISTAIFIGYKCWDIKTEMRARPEKIVDYDNDGIDDLYVLYQREYSRLGSLYPDRGLINGRDLPDTAENLLSSKVSFWTRSYKIDFVEKKMDSGE